MTPLVVAAVLCAAVTHAAWNAIAHAITDKYVALTLITAGGAGCGALLACLAPFPAAGAWPYLLASVAIHIAYQYLLMASFRLGEFGQVYPIARGIAPLVVTALAAVFVGELPGAWQLAGVLLASAGLGGVALWGLRGGGHSWPAVAAAVGTGLTIAAYTVTDGVGARASGTAAGYTGWLLLVQGVLLAPSCVALRGRELLALARPVAVRGLTGGALSVFAYGLVLWAQTRGDLAPIAALRETSIIAGAAIGALFFKERFGRPRLVGAVLVVAGIGLMLHNTTG